MRRWSPVAWIRSLCATAAVLGLIGCGGEKEERPKQQKVMLSVTTVDLQGKPVEMVRFYINGKKFGITDQDGRFRGQYPAKDGEMLSFNVDPPQGYSVPPNIDQSRWQVRIKYPEDGRPLQVDFKAFLQRPPRDYLFMVRTADPATPVKVNGELVGKTGPTGDALLRVEGVPGSKFIARAGSVSYQGTFAEDDEVYLLTAERSGPLGGKAAGEEAVAAKPAEPEAPSEPEVADEPDRPKEPARPAVARRNEREPDDPWRVGGTGSMARAGRDDRPARQPDRPPRPEPKPEPWEPPSERVEVAEAPPPTPAIDIAEDPEPPTLAADSPSLDILGDDEPSSGGAGSTPDVVAGGAGPSKNEPTGDLLDDGARVVDREIAERRVAVAGGSGPSAVGMSREEISARLEEIKSRLGQSRVLKRADVEFLGQIDRTHPGYYEAHRLLADYYFELKDYRRQAEELEIATSRGRYRRDPTLLLSLAKAYAKQRRYRKALSVMRRVEVNMRRLPANMKADTYRFHAEMYEFEFLRQYHEDAKKANVTLLDGALQQWERYQTFSRGADPQAVALADKKIKKLKELKSGLEL